VIIVEVQDHGRGIHPDERRQIFEQFRQITSDTLSDKPHGNGLGLAITKEIIDRHYAQIEIESELGVGTLFRVKLPVLRRFAQLDPYPAPAPQPD
jgi:two-component system phosphate regulon sensor histidine kinase PhoR